MSRPTSSEAIVIKIWATFFPKQEIDSSSHFFDLGGDSLTAINMSLAVERETGFQVPIGTIYNGPILKDFVEIISSFQTEDKRPIVTPLQTRGNQTPLFAIAPAVGGVFHYRDFGKRLRNDQPCYCLEPRISALGEHSYKSVEEIAEWKINAIKEIQVEGPYRLCGYSFGGSIAWEVAKILKARGEEVELLLAFDTIARGKEFHQPRFTGSLLNKTKRLFVRLKQLNGTYKRHKAKLSWVNVGVLICVKAQYFFKRSVLNKIGLNFDVEETTAAKIENQVQNTLRCVYDYGTYDGELTS
jgi:acyl carrier protein